MISTVRGTVPDIAFDHVVIEIGDAASGVGLAVRTTPGVLAGLRTDSETTLATVLMVGEDALTPYGVPGSAARELFLLLPTVPGIGPRVALAALAVFTPDQLRLALTSEETTTLTRVPGIGRKGAERWIIELRDQVSPPAAVGATPPTAAGSPAAPGLARTLCKPSLVSASPRGRPSRPSAPSPPITHPSLPSTQPGPYARPLPTWVHAGNPTPPPPRTDPSAQPDELDPVHPALAWLGDVCEGTGKRDEPAGQRAESA
jgi:Holliday junction DNA helicase RuvA